LNFRVSVTQNGFKITPEAGKPQVASKDPELRKKYGPRGVIKATAGGKIEDTGPFDPQASRSTTERSRPGWLDPSPAMKHKET